ncbi:MAG: hypothetical protein HYX47_12050 [Burkholderiales bacterium]|nr:hypothetical protein [Burkholderiales bacterium]
MKEGEDRFWLEVANQLNPDWHVHMGDGAARIPLAQQDTFLYMFDTSTMWVAAGVTMASEMLRARRQLQGLKLEPGLVAGLAGEAILECGKANLPGDHADTQRAMTATICSITATVTWSTVMDRIGSPAGHWIWMAYRLRDGDTLGRPVFGQGPRAFMQQSDVHRSVRTALLADLGNPRSSVNQRVTAGGGANLHPTLQGWLTDPPASNGNSPTR